MSINVEMESNSKLQRSILSGVDILTDFVSSTLGPRGRNVILQQKDKKPFITKDGVTVARFVHLEDKIENLGAQIIKQASEQTANQAGDGTTTSTVLARAILQNAQKYLAAGVSPIEIKRGLDKAVEKIVENLKEMSKPVESLEDIEHIATISANGDKSIGKLIVTAIEQVGNDGAVQIEDGRGLETSLEVVEGFQLDTGYISQAFITDERRGICRLESPLIFVTDYKLESVDELLPLLEVIARDGRPLVVVAEEVTGQALAALIMNTVRGTMKISVVKPPSYGHERRKIMADLACTIGSAFVTRESGLKIKDIKLEHLGLTKSVEIYKNNTIFVGGKGNPKEIDKKIESLKNEIEQTDSMHECEKIQERIARLASGVAIIKVGASTEVEMEEKKHRVEDALEAVYSAQAEGILPGGGVALVRSSQNLVVDTPNEEQLIGVKLLLESVKEPVRQIAKNAGLSPDITLSIIESENFECGIDYTTNKVVNMYGEGIIDPTKVTRCALQNAVSSAGTLLTTSHAIVEI